MGQVGYYFDKTQATIVVYCNGVELFREFKRGRTVIRRRLRIICTALKGTNAYVDLKYLIFKKDLEKERERWAKRVLIKKGLL